jgi:hypothetical protein
MRDNNNISPGVLLILGNGFDLNLGYKTSYRDFFNAVQKDGSRYFPFVEGGNDYYKLGSYVLQQASKENWYNLEQILGKYGTSRIGDNDPDLFNQDKNDYERLRDALSRYLLSIDYSKPKSDSIAARVLYSIMNCIATSKVYTFNYTDLSNTANYLRLNIDDPVFVHGSIKNRDIILGVGDFTQLDKNCEFMYKSTHRINTNQLFYDLELYEDIVFFGISLSSDDYSYFEDFFVELSAGNLGKKYIRIITKDLSSEQAVLRNLRNMKTNIQKLKGRADFDIIKTESQHDTDKVEAMLNHIANAWNLDV